jgi:hypothetical protein
VRQLNRNRLEAAILSRMGEARWYHTGGDSPNDLLARSRVEAIIREEMGKL